MIDMLLMLIASTATTFPSVQSPDVHRVGNKVHS
jgi:hypothetical protein